MQFFSPQNTLQEFLIRDQQGNNGSWQKMIILGSVGERMGKLGGKFLVSVVSFFSLSSLKVPNGLDDLRGLFNKM